MLSIIFFMTDFDHMIVGFLGEAKFHKKINVQDSVNPLSE